MKTVKDILIDALDRTNLVPRKRIAPADMLESAYRLFCGIIKKYSFDNFINYARTEQNLNATSDKMVIETDNVESISNVMWKLNNSLYSEMNFVSYDEFYSTDDIYAYTWKFDIDNNIELYLKPQFINNNRIVKIILNSKLNYGINDELKIPAVYEELFTAALAYKLSIAYPRVDAQKKTDLKIELDEVEKTVKAMISSNKALTRNTSVGTNWSNFVSGRFIF